MVFFFKNMSLQIVYPSKEKSILYFHHEECTFEIWEPYLSPWRSYCQGYKVLGSSSEFKVMVTSSKLWYMYNVLSQVHVKYENTYQYRLLMNKVKVFFVTDEQTDKQIDRQTEEWDFMSSRFGTKRSAKIWRYESLVNSYVNLYLIIQNRNMKDPIPSQPLFYIKASFLSEKSS